jgi:hypothetical protein
VEGVQPCPGPSSRPWLWLEGDKRPFKEGAASERVIYSPAQHARGEDALGWPWFGPLLVPTRALCGAGTGHSIDHGGPLPPVGGLYVFLQTADAMKPSS